jgi:hypothetical protein
VLVARHTCRVVATCDGFLTKQELDARFEALRATTAREPVAPAEAPIRA